VRARDAAGNVDPYPASHSWSVGQYVKLIVNGSDVTSHFTIIDAYSLLSQLTELSQAEIHLKGRVFQEDFENGLPIPLKLVGGFGQDFYSQSGVMSTVKGPLSLLDGQVTIDSIIIK
jgi:hypothetical protein